MYAYELLFRPSIVAESAESASERASARVITDAVLSFGLDTLTQGKPAFINVTRRLLLDGIPAALPPTRVVIELLEDVEADEEVIAACRELRRAGYAIALDDFALNERTAGLLPLADFVILTVPHTPATEGFMNRARFQRMKRTAFFINIGRGMTTRLDDLVAALRAGEIAGAGLDVFEQEPLPADHPLWTMPGVLITPHTAGHGPFLDDRRLEVLLDNCRRFLSGQSLRNVVDKANWF